METWLCSKWVGFSDSLKNRWINKDVRWPSWKTSQWFSTSHNSSRHKHHHLQTRPSAHHRAKNYLSRTNSPLQFAWGSSCTQVKKVPKSNYLQLATDLEDSGWSVSYFTLEIGSLGHFEPNATRTLSDAFLLSKQEAKQILMKLSRIAVSCSYHIFNARLSSTWDVNKPVCS